jgi:hypothetical protein
MAQIVKPEMLLMLKDNTINDIIINNQNTDANVVVLPLIWFATIIDNTHATIVQNLSEPFCCSTNND